MKRIVETTIFTTISLWSLLSFSSNSPRSLGDYEEFLSPRSSEAEEFKNTISSSLKRTKSLPEARERFLELQQEIKLTHPDKMIGQQEELLNHLQDAYAQHLHKTPLVINGDKSSLSGDKLLQTYAAMTEQLNNIIAHPILTKPLKQSSKGSSSPRPNNGLNHIDSLHDHLATLGKINKILIRTQPYHEHLVKGSDIQRNLDRARQEVKKLYYSIRKSISATMEQAQKKDKTRHYGMTPAYEEKIQKLIQQEARAQAEHEAHQKKLAKKFYFSDKQRVADQEKQETEWTAQQAQFLQQKIKALQENMGALIQHLLNIKGRAQREYDDQYFNDNEETISIIEELLSSACPYMTEKELASARNTVEFFEETLDISLIDQKRELTARGGFIHNLIVNSTMEHKTTYLPRRNKTLQLVMEELKKLGLLAQTPDEEKTK